MKNILFALMLALAFNISAYAAVNINTATQAQLESLDGIGPVKAKAIIDYRKKNGNFKSVDDLEKVDGVGAVTLKSVRKDVSISGQTTVAAPAAKTTSATKTSTKTKKTVSKTSKAKPAATKAAVTTTTKTTP